MTSRPEAGAPSDEALVAAFLEGDDTAFDRLVERYDRWVYGICYRYFRDTADAEDAAQETFVAVLRRASTFTGAARFSTWLYRVAMNACNDLARKRDRRPRTVPLARPSHDAPGDADLDIAGDTADPTDVLAGRELGMELTAALRRLDAEHARTVVLHDVYGFGQAEIAASLGVAVGTVKSRLHRARGRLAQQLGHLRSASASREPLEASDPPTEQQ